MSNTSVTLSSSPRPLEFHDATLMAALLHPVVAIENANAMLDAMGEVDAMQRCCMQTQVGSTNLSNCYWYRVQCSTRWLKVKYYADLCRRHRRALSALKESK